MGSSRCEDVFVTVASGEYLKCETHQAALVHQLSVKLAVESNKAHLTDAKLSLIESHYQTWREACGLREHELTAACAKAGHRRIQLWGEVCVCPWR